MKFKNLKTNTFINAIGSLSQELLKDKDYRLAVDSDFNESDHPRASNGQFGSKGGSSTSIASEPSKASESGSSSKSAKSLTSSEKKAWKKQYAENEDKNFHSENVLMEAELVGSEEDIKEVKEINKRHEERGHISHEDYEKRNEISKRLQSKVKEALSEKSAGSEYPPVKKLSPAQKEIWDAKYRENEDKNYHAENALMEAKLVGSEEDIKEIREINKRHIKVGHLSHEDYEKRNAISKKLVPRLKEALGE